MIRVAICDDNSAFANGVENDLLLAAGEMLDCDVYQSGAQLTERLRKGEAPYHIYFMDIEMPRQNGIDTALMIRKNDRDALIVFITDYKEYVYDVFEALPFRFLQKPVSAADLRRVLTDAMEQIRRSGQIFFFQSGREEYQLRYREIFYFEGAGRKVKIKTAGETFEIYHKISDIAAKLDSSLFCRIHASFVVNMEWIRCVKNSEIVLEDGTALPVSKRYRCGTKQAHLAFLERRCGI